MIKDLNLSMIAWIIQDKRDSQIGKPLLFVSQSMIATKNLANYLGYPHHGTELQSQWRSRQLIITTVSCTCLLRTSRFRTVCEK